MAFFCFHTLPNLYMLADNGVKEWLVTNPKCFKKRHHLLPTLICYILSPLSRSSTENNCEAM